MKRFRWPLHRLLEVSAQREAALAAELLALTQELARCHGRIVAAQAHLRAMLEQVAAQQDLGGRIRLQELLLSSSQTIQRRIEQWKLQVRELQQKRAETTERLLAAKRKRQTLEKLQEQALQRYRQEQARLEQVDLDEAAGVAFARRMAQSPQMVGVN